MTLLSMLLVLFVITVGFFNSAPSRAEGGIAISGSFYQQSFEIPPDSSISSPDVNVVVFNTGSDQLNVRMISQAPPGVSLVLSKSEFTLPAFGQQMILVEVMVGTDVVPDEYEITISAESYKEDATGIQLLGAASQRASLTVLGEYGMVNVQTRSLAQQPVMATVRLYRVVSGNLHEVAYGEEGTIEKRVAPGSYVAVSYMSGIKLDEERFDVAAGESKTITLSGETAYFEGFDIVPNYYNSNGKLAFVQIVYTVRNLYQRVDESEVILQVSRDGDLPIELTLATLSPLETGRVGLNYSYVPDGGWVDGSYDFQLQLNLDGEPYTNSEVKQLTVIGESDGGMSSYVIGIIVAVAVVITGIVLLFVRKTRRR